MRQRRFSTRGDSGLTLVELLVSITVLGIISFALTEAIIQGLRATDGTAANISDATGTQILSSYFSSDVQSAETASSTHGTCRPPSGVYEDTVFLSLTKTEDGPTQIVSYSYSEAAGEFKEDVVRWTCFDDDPPAQGQVLAHFVHDAADPEVPVSVHCDEAPNCLESAAAFSSVTLELQNSPRALSPESRAARTTQELTVRRRST